MEPELHFGNQEFLFLAPVHRELVFSGHRLEDLPHVREESMNVFRKVMFATVQVTLLLLFAASVFAQETTAGLQGTVKDPSGAVVSGAQVVVTADTLVGSKTSDRKSTRLNSSHQIISYAVFCLDTQKYL